MELSPIDHTEFASRLQCSTRVTDLSPVVVSGSALVARHVDSKFDRVSGGFAWGSMRRRSPVDFRCAMSSVRGSELHVERLAV